jgi:hypothetical protein
MTGDWQKNLTQAPPWSTQKVGERGTIYNVTVIMKNGAKIGFVVMAYRVITRI